MPILAHMHFAPLLLLAGLLALGNTALAAPARIYLLRHAEKPLDDENPHLSAKGKKRALALVDLLGGKGAPRFRRVNKIFAAVPNRAGGSLRSIETMTPLSRTLEISIDRTYSKETTSALARTLLRDEAFDGAVVAIAWPRDEIPELAETLGIPDPPAWPKETFDRVWAFSFDDRGHGQMADLPMRLLPGDSDRRVESVLW